MRVFAGSEGYARRATAGFRCSWAPGLVGTWRVSTLWPLLRLSTVGSCRFSFEPVIRIQIQPSWPGRNHEGLINTAKFDCVERKFVMMKRMIIALAGLFAVLGLAVGTAGAAPSASSGGAGTEAAPVDVFRTWTTLGYSGTGVARQQSTVDPGSPNASCVSLGAPAVTSAALIDGAFQVELFAASDCVGEPLATLTAVNRADSGIVTGTQPTRLGDVGATAYIATPIP